MSALKVGMIGVGKIAPAYVKGLSLFPQDVKLTACADMNADRAKEFAQEYGIQAMTVDELLASDVDIVLNLTIPIAHAEVALKAIAAGKHVHSEKPLAIERADGQAVVKAAQAKGVRAGCAPDTFLGGGIQTARALIDSGAIGTPVSATAFMMGHGPEGWHPNPFFYYQKGGGPVLDMGPYYLTALVNLLGGISGVSALTGRAFEQRVAGHESVKGQTMPVEVSTHASASLQFANGAIGTMIMSFDVWAHHMPRIEIHGTEGSLSVPDPNHFDGVVSLWKPDSGQWREMPHTHRTDVLRGMGVVDMARAIQGNSAHRASAELAQHVLDVMLAFDESAEQGKLVRIEPVARPEALPANLG